MPIPMPKKKDANRSFIRVPAPMKDLAASSTSSLLSQVGVLVGIGYHKGYTLSRFMGYSAMLLGSPFYISLADLRA